MNEQTTADQARRLADYLAVCRAECITVNVDQALSMISGLLSCLVAPADTAPADTAPADTAPADTTTSH